MPGTTFKVHYGQECRRFKHTDETGPTVAWLRERLHVPAGASTRLSWKDEDGDMITIVDDSDLAEAVLAQRAGPVRLILSEHADTSPVSPVTLRPDAQPEGWVQAESQQQQRQQPGASAPEPAPAPAPAPVPAPDAPSADQQAQREFETKMATLVETVAGAVRDSGLFPEQMLETITVEPEFLRGAAGMAFLPPHFLPPPRCGGGGGARRRGCGGRVHHHVICDHSGMNPIVGTRFHKMGEDFDLCEEEFAKLSEDDKVRYEVIQRRGARPVPFAEWKTAKKAGARKGCAKKAGGRKPGDHKAGRRPQGAYHAWAANAVVAAGDVLPAATLETGRFGPGVEQLQRFLIEHDLMNEGAIRWRAGLFGPRTAHALHEFQARNNLHGATPGVFDEATRAALLQHVAQPVPSQGLGGAAAEPVAEPVAEPEPEPVAEPEQDRYEVVYEEAPPSSDSVAPAGAARAAAPGSAPASTTVTAPAAESRWAHELSILESMGFAKSDDLVQQLDRAQGSINIVVSHLLQ